MTARERIEELLEKGRSALAELQSEHSSDVNPEHRIVPMQTLIDFQRGQNLGAEECLTILAAEERKTCGECGHFGPVGEHKPIGNCDRPGHGWCILTVWQDGYGCPGWEAKANE